MANVLESPTNPFSDAVIEPLNTSSKITGLSFDETYPFRDDSDVPLSNVSHNMGLSFVETSPLDSRPLTSESFSTSTSPLSDGAVDVSMSNAPHNVGFSVDETIPLGTTEESLTSGSFSPSFSNWGGVHTSNVSHSMGLSFPETSPRSLTSESLATSTSPFSGGVDDVPMSNVSQNIESSVDENFPLGTTEEHKSLTSGSLAPSTSPFSDCGGVPTSNVSNNMGLSFAETSLLDSEKDSRPLTSESLASTTSPFSEGVVDVPMSNVSQNVGLSVDETYPLGTTEEHSSLTSGSLAPSDGFDFPSNNISNSMEPLTSENLGTSSSPLSNDIDAPTSNVSQSSNSLDVRSLNSVPSQTKFSFGEKTRLDMAPLTTQNLNSPQPLSSSPVSTLDDPYGEINDKKTSTSAPVTEAAANHPISSTNETNSPVTVVSPPVQVMERATPKYRIPSHVFEREKSKGYSGWSLPASNESLFSIQMGNSFTTDSFPSYSLRQYSDINVVSDNSLGLTESDLQTVEDVSRDSENECQETPRLSQGSSISAKSFQFPILADVDKCNSINISGSPTHTSATTQEQTQTQTLPTPKPTEVVQQTEEAVQPTEDVVQPPETNASQTTQPKAETSWFNKLFCCPFCPQPSSSV